MLKEPEYLKSGDKISLVAPSFGCTTNPYKDELVRAINNLKEYGFNIYEGENIYKNEGVLASASPKKRAKEFMEAYLSDASLILSVGGGEFENEILPYIDFNLIKNSIPKWFMGFSDNTNLAFCLTTISKVISIYGPCAPSFDLFPFKLEIKDSLKMLEGKKHFRGYKRWQLESKRDEFHPFEPLNLTKKKIIIPYKYKEAKEGMIIGGCIDCLANLCGTRFDNVKNFIKENKKNGFIRYLESCDLNPLSFRRALFLLKEAGWFKYVKMFLMGRPYHFNEEIMGLTFIKSAKDILKSFNVPILFNIDLGHLPPSMPFKNGAIAKVSLIDNNIDIKYK